MTPLLTQTIAAVVMLATLMRLLLMGYLLWLQCRGVVEPDRQHGGRRHNGYPHSARGVIHCP